MGPTTSFANRLVLSYIIDWILLVVITGAGIAVWRVDGNHRPFSPVDPNISFPHVEHEKISSAVLVVISLLIPAIITALVALIVTPGSTVPKNTARARIWKYKVWELNTAWMGLALGLATTFFFTESLKSLTGKPRPDLLARCDLDPNVVQQYALGGEGTQLPLWNLLISDTACRQPDYSKLKDGFTSFPSGHASYSWTGMFYLALYLCSKFSVAIPYLLPHSYSSLDSTRNSFLGCSVDQADEDKNDVSGSREPAPLPPRKQAAAPPVYTFLLPVIPIAVATYVASTRFSDFRHHGFDIIFGSLLGILSATICFRMYHMPIGRGGGWSWGPRSVSKAFGVGVGTQGYATGEEGHHRRDIEDRGPSSEIPLRPR